jgi:hypothetical protein
MIIFIIKILMSKIIKITTGEAAFVLEEHFETKEKASEGTEPVSQEFKQMEIKIENTKWKKTNE